MAAPTPRRHRRRSSPKTDQINGEDQMIGDQITALDDRRLVINNVRAQIQTREISLSLSSAGTRWELWKKLFVFFSFCAELKMTIFLFGTNSFSYDTNGSTF